MVTLRMVLFDVVLALFAKRPRSLENCPQISLWLFRGMFVWFHISSTETMHAGLVPDHIALDTLTYNWKKKDAVTGPTRMYHLGR